MDLIATLRTFLRVAETRSFSAVASERGMTQPAISRQVTALEEHLGTNLVQRNTQFVTLTDDGRNLLPAARELVDQADEMLEAARNRRGRPIGLVRIAVSVPLGMYLGRHINKLLDQHEGLSVELVLRDRYGNLMEDGLDAEIRVGDRSDSSLVSRRVGSTSRWTVASPEYLASRSIPTHPRDLTHHQCIVHHKEGSDDVWWFEDPNGKPDEEISVNVRGRFSADNAAAVYHAVLAGQGIACLSHLLLREDVTRSRLVQLLPEYRPRRYPIYVDYPSRKNLPPRVRTVIEYLLQIAKDDPLFSP